MSARTYIPGLILLVKHACRFMDRYDAKIRAGLPSEQIVLYDSVKTACDAFEAIIPLIEPALGD